MTSSPISTTRSGSNMSTKKRVEKRLSVEESLSKNRDLPEDRRNELRALRDAEGQLVWYRADKIRETVEEAGPENLMLCYALIARDVGRTVSSVRSDLLISRLFDSGTREEFGALSVSYFRAASMYQRSPRAVLERVILTAEKRSGRGDFCTVEKAYQIAKELRERDEGREPDPAIVIIHRRFDRVAVDLRKITQIEAPEISRSMRSRLLQIANEADELLTGLAQELADREEET